MISTQPILSFRYFKFKKNKLAENVKRLFYLSWEDAFWDILLKKKVPKGSYVLLPDFFCGDVESNIRLHGCKPVYYKINTNLTADKKSFKSKIERVKPSVIVIFHPVGIKSNLMDDLKWLKKITGSSILIEDSVHRIVDPEEIKIFKKDHFIIDSLRKVVPLQGSNIYGRVEDLDFSAPPFYQSFFYSIRVNLLWALMVLGWSLRFGRIAERLMLRGYSLIGDSMLPARGPFPANFLSSRINTGEIRDIRKHQAIYYEKELGKFLPVKISLSGEDRASLRAYPVILDKEYAGWILKFLRTNDLLVRFELNDSGWSRKQKIIYLPLGIQMTEKEQGTVCGLVKSALLGYRA